MRRIARISLLLMFAFGAGCSSSGSKSDGGGVDGQGCPAQMPNNMGAACTGSTVCEYGQSTCCGMTYSFMTCTCRDGTFDCVQTVECNFVCPDAGSGG
jgi:hypothetical protein